MLKRFEVTNYKNFKDKIVIDLSKVGGYQFNQDCITDNVIGKMLVYGRNATGKTNLGVALMDIADVIVGQRISYGRAGAFLNADSEEKSAEFSYTFIFDGKEVKYVYRKVSESQLLDEELSIDDKKAFYFNFWTNEGKFDLEILDADTAIIKRYLDSIEDVSYDDDRDGNLPFLRWLINNTALQEGSVLLLLDDYVKRMNMLTAGAGMLRRTARTNEVFYEMLSIDDNLKDFEDFLNIMGVECKLRLLQLPGGQKELYFVHNIPVPFGDTASSGTLILTSLYRRLMLRKESSLLYVDEFDAFYHYEMSEKVIMFFKKKYPNSQLIFTTHNTNLMTNKIMRPDCLFIISRMGQLTALCDATQRELREGHNLEKLYISGEFEKYE